MRTLGVEVGRAAVRVVAGEPRRDRLQLGEAATLPLPDQQPAALISALETFAETHGRGGSQVAVALPLRLCSVKILTFPATSPENLARLVRVEAESQFPLPAESIEYSHSVIAGGEADGQVRVVVAAARKDVVADHLKPFEATGLTPQVVDVSAVALANAFVGPVREQGQPTALLNLDGPFAELVVLDAQGGLSLVRALRGEAATVAPQVARTLQTEASRGGPEVQRLILTGPDAAAAAAVFAEAGVDAVEVGDPWAHSSGAERMLDQAAPYGVATGLVWRGGEPAYRLNLVPRARTEAATQARRTSMAGLAVGLVFALLLLAGGIMFSAWQARRAQVERLEAQVARLEAEQREVGGLDPAFVQRLLDTRAEVEQQSDWLEMLRALSARLPAGVALEELTLDRARPVILRGQAYSNVAIAQALDVVNDLGVFQRVRLDYANLEPVGGQAVYNFQITGLWPEADQRGDGR